MLFATAGYYFGIKKENWMALFSTILGLLFLSIFNYLDKRANMKKPSLINVQLSQKHFINTPTLQELDKIKRGQVVKVGNRFESFLVDVTAVNGSIIEGIINETELTHTKKHGLHDRDFIQFHKCNVISIIN